MKTTASNSSMNNVGGRKMLHNISTSFPWRSILCFDIKYSQYSLISFEVKSIILHGYQSLPIYINSSTVQLGTMSLKIIFLFTVLPKPTDIL